jgi:hypothetical protein
MNGVEAFPNNITILRFLDLDLTNIERLNETVNERNNANSENCAQCKHQKHQNFFKCLDCEKSFCANCKPSHLVQLKNETKQSVHNLRKSLPKLSQNVGKYHYAEETNVVGSLRRRRRKRRSFL